MQNGDESSATAKVSKAERVVQMLWAWSGVLFPHEQKQRWSSSDKTIVMKTIGRLMFAAIALFVLGGALGFLTPPAITLIKKPFRAMAVHKQITDKILEVNPSIDPTIAAAGAQVLIDESPPLDPRWMLWMGIAESKFHLKAKSEKKAEGLFQLLETTQNDENLPEMERYNLIPQTGRAKRELLKCYAKRGTVRGMLDCYIAGPNADTKKLSPTAIAEMNRYAAEIAAGYVDYTNAWKK